MKNAQQIGMELCEVWGINPNKVRAITIRLRLNAPPEVLLDMIDDQFVDVVKRYELHDPDSIEGVA